MARLPKSIRRMACRHINENRVEQNGIDYDDLLERRTESGNKTYCFFIDLASRIDEMDSFSRKVAYST